GVERVLVEVAIEADAEPVLRRADVGEDRLLGGVAERGAVVVHERVAVALHEPARDVADVVSLVAVLGEVGGPADRLEVARAHRLGEDLHLAAGVVEVVLALDVVIGAGEEPGERVAEDGVPPVTDGERSGRVRAHELDLDSRAAPEGGDAEGGVVAHARELLVPEAVGELDVDESGTRDVARRDPGARVVQVPEQDLRDRARRLPLGARERHPERAGDVAELAVARHLEERLGHRFAGELPALARGRERAPEERLDPLHHRRALALETRARGVAAPGDGAGRASRSPGASARAWSAENASGNTHRRYRLHPRRSNPRSPRR